MPIRTAGDAIFGLLMCSFSGLVIVGMLIQTPRQGNFWIPPVLMGFMFLMGLYLILQHVPRIFGSACINIDSRKMTIQESFWPTGSYRSVWHMDNIDFIRVCNQPKPRGEYSSSFTLPALLRVQVWGKDESEDLILVARQKRELIWACDVLNDYLKRETE